MFHSHDYFSFYNGKAAKLMATTASSPPNVGGGRENDANDQYKRYRFD
jgi:hypothetical protein